MASKITLVESVIKVGFDDKAARRGLKRLKKQLADKDKMEMVSERRADRKQRNEERNQRKNHKAAIKERKDEKKHSKGMTASEARERRENRRERTENNRERRAEELHQRRMSESQDRMSRAKNRERRAEQRHRKSMLRGSVIGGTRIGRGNAGVVGTFASAGAAAYVGQQYLSAEEARTQIRSDYIINRKMSESDAVKQTNLAMAKLQTVADELKIPLSEVAKEFVASAGVARSTGMNLDQRVAWTRMWAMTPRAFGASQQDAAALRTNFAQIFSSISQGKAPDFQDLRQLFERNRALADWVFKKAGVSNADEFQQAVLDKRITETSLAGSLLQGDTAVENAYFWRLNNTAAGAIQQFTAALNNAAIRFGDGASTGFSGMVTQIATALNGNDALFKSAGDVLGKLFMAVGGMFEAFNQLPVEMQGDILKTMVATLGLLVSQKMLTVLTLFRGTLLAMSIALAPLIIAANLLQELFSSWKDGGRSTATKWARGAGLIGDDEELPESYDFLFSKDWDETKKNFTEKNLEPLLDELDKKYNPAREMNDILNDLPLSNNLVIPSESTGMTGGSITEKVITNNNGDTVTASTMIVQADSEGRMNLKARIYT